MTVPRKGRFFGRGLLPTITAVRLSVARAATYVRYFGSLAAPAEVFSGWTESESGYVLR